jgi:hypothetical protein
MHLLRAALVYVSTCLTWRSSRRIACGPPRPRVVKRADGMLYIEPRA